MKLLFIPSILSGDWTRLKALLIVLAVLYTCVFVAVLIDLLFGVRRARRLKIKRTSSGYRRTISKLTSYFGLMFMLTMADIAASIVFNMPYFSVFGAIGIVAVEAKSVFENLRQAEKEMADIQTLMYKLFENREELQAFISFINSKNTEDSHDTKRITQ